MDFLAELARCDRETVVSAGNMERDHKWVIGYADWQTERNVIMDKLHETMVKFSGGTTSSSKASDFRYIPTEAMVRLANRFALGVQKRPDGTAWNALSHNQDCLKDKDFILERISHVIDHALKLRDKIQAQAPLGDDDAGAIIWAGAFLCCATKALADLDSEASQK